MLPPSLLVFSYKGWADWSQLRESNEALPRASVAQAKETNGPTPPLLNRAGYEAGWAGQRQDPLFFLSGIFPFLSGISPQFPLLLPITNPIHIYSS